MRDKPVPGHLSLKQPLAGSANRFARTPLPPAPFRAVQRQPGRPAAPPVYNPNAKAVLAPKPHGGGPPVFRPNSSVVNSKRVSRYSVESRQAPPVYNPYNRAVTAKAATPVSRISTPLVPPFRAPSGHRPGPPAYRPFVGGAKGPSLPQPPSAKPSTVQANIVQRAQSQRMVFPSDIMAELNAEVDALGYGLGLEQAEFVEDDAPEFPSQHVEAGERERLGAVSLSSGIHHFELLAQNYKAVVTQPWGFSVAKKALQQTDLVKINAYIVKWNSGAVVAKIHRRGEGNKILYEVDGRTYSTHEDSNQLYPIHGPGIASGNGPADMYRLLKAIGKADPAKIIKLYEQLLGTQSEEYTSAAKKKKEGGHRSAVKIPKAKTTSAGNLKKMKPGALEALKAEAEEALTQPASAQYSNRLDEA